MTATRFIPFLIAGFVGFLIGWMLGPDVADVEASLSQRIDAVGTRVGGLEAPLADLKSQVTAIGDQTKSLADHVGTLPDPSEGLAALNEKLDQLAQNLGKRGDALEASAEQQQQALQPVTQQLTALGEAVKQLGQRLDTVDQRLASLGSGSQSPASPSAGTAGRASSPEPASGQPAATGQSASPGTGTQASAATGSVAALGSTRVFVSGLDANGAWLVPSGGSRQRVAVGSAIDAGNGCRVTLTAIETGAAELTGAGCDGGQHGNTGADQAQPADQPSSTQPAAQQSDPRAGGDTGATAAGQAAAAQPAPGDGGQTPDKGAAAVDASGGDGLQTGQTRSFGSQKVFVSATHDNGATLFVVGSGRRELVAGDTAKIDGSCSIKLDRVENRRAYLSAQGC
ncbi:hypothetical protein NPA31_003555 [Aurantimonas sp. MSK8Z-1]|uniref:hypothetical protein n=1 Tax=Mangrovibrevibacter kandeliae TaxID=2968473 RepID=UPI0021193F17|nr:hypothetical protein [Aurantimonas sp. MSK8Z-1]MCW4114041.1 hypothetical protein [Aurantimonas sp. MSK8Z-1]